MPGDVTKSADQSLWKPVSFVIAKMILRALARLHAVNWDMFGCRKSPLVKWIYEKNPKADTTSFFYPMKFGLWPRGKELPDVSAPFSFGVRSHLSLFVSLSLSLF